MYRVVAKGYKSNQLKASVEDILGQTKYLTMATASLDGEPWANTVAFAATNSLTLYVVTYPNSKHMQNLNENNRLALNVVDTSQDGRKRHGLQLTATCLLLPESEWEAALQIWGARISGLERVPILLEKITCGTLQLYEFTIDSAKIFDEACFGTEVWITATVER